MRLSREALVRIALTASLAPATQRPALAAEKLPPCQSTALSDAKCEPYAAPQSEFVLKVPDEFVQIPRSGLKSSNIIFSSGNFAKASTLTVQSLELQQLLPNGLTAGGLAESADALANALVSFRDAGVSAPTGSTIEAPGPRVDANALDFVFDTSLVSPPSDDPEYSRVTAARALLLAAPGESLGAPSTRVLVAWGGAKRSEWDKGMGETLRAAVASFSAP